MESVIEVYMREDDNDIETKMEPQSIKALFSDFQDSSKSSDSSEYDEEAKHVIVEYPRKQRKRSCKTYDDTPKKRIYMQKYRKEWESIPAYKPWLSESVLGNLHFYCKFCKNNNKCGRTEIEKHMICMKHIRNSKMPQHRTQRKFTLRGLLCSAFTPFINRENEVNYSHIPKYAKYLLDSNVKAILINDIVGEGMTLTSSERMKITEEWMKICEVTKQHLMVQVGGAPIKEIQEMVRHAEKKKVGSIVVLPDLYNKPKDHYDLMRYIKLVSDSANTIPLLYHHNPTYTGVDIDMTKFLNDILGEIDSFVGIIFTDNNLKDAKAALQVNINRFTVFLGTDEIMLGSLASGFGSFVSTTLNFIPQIVHQIHGFFKENNFEEAKKSQDLLNNRLELIYRHGEQLPALKAAMNILTPVSVGLVRDPLVPIWQDKINKMKCDLQYIKSEP